MKLGILGGSGLYELEGLHDVRVREVRTPFGKPSDPLVCGRLGDQEIVFLPRHGRGHRLLPSEINHRANIYALKQLGVERVLSVSAVGSLRGDRRPRDIVLPDQYVDRTKSSDSHTFFGGGLVAHITFADPTCAEFRRLLATAARAVLPRLGGRTRPRLFQGGIYVNIEGPAFSTRAESHLYRRLGFDVIGMTSLPEAKLCREAELCYQAMAMVTDFDCWHETEGPVSVEQVIGHLRANTTLAKAIIAELVPLCSRPRQCACPNALQNAILTDRSLVPPATRRKLGLLVKRYFPAVPTA